METMKSCDLHTHSVYSDGTWTPLQLVEEAERIGLQAIALTDHNTVAGLPEFLAAAKDKCVEAVPGIEFSTDYADKDVHILGLFIRPEHYEVITELLADVQKRKDQSNADLAAALNAAGYAIDYEKMKSSTPDGQINRAHFAAELTRLGYTESMKAAFDRLLKPERGYYHPPKRMSSFEAIDFIKSLGAVAVWAHPYLTLAAEQVPVFLEEAVRHGLDGMETVYVTYDEETTALAKQTAAQFGLLESGGSDFHGGNKPDIRLGEGRGSLVVPMELLKSLEQRQKSGK